MAVLDSNERSSFWGVGATAAILGGVGYGLYKHRAPLVSALSMDISDTAARSVSNLASLGRFSVGHMPMATMAEFSEDALFRLHQSLSTGKRGLLRTDIATAAYQSILSGGKATANEAYAEFLKIRGQSSVRSVYEQARLSIQQLSGDPGVLFKRLGDLGEGGFYTTSRQDELLSKAILSPGLGLERERAAFTGELGQRAADVRRRLSQAAAASGGQITWKGEYLVRDVLEGQQITTPMLRGRIGGEVLNIPLANTGLTYGGENLATRYVTRQAFDMSGQLKNFTDEYVTKLEEAMMVQKHKTGLKRAVLETNRQIISAIHERDAAARSMAIWKAPEPFLTSGGRVRARMNALEAVYAGPGKMTEELREGIIRETFGGKMGLWPVGSPETVAKGTFMTANVAEDLYGPLGRFFPVEYRPTQFIREEWGATAAAKAAAPPFKGAFGQAYSRLERKIQGPAWEALLYGGAPATAAEAYTAPQLMTFYAKPSVLEAGPLAGVMAKEEAVIGAKTRPFMEYERIVQKKITTERGFQISKELAEGLGKTGIGEAWTAAAPFGAGGFVGIERGTGKEIWLPASRDISSAIVGAQVTGPGEANVFIREQHRLARGEYWKFFSEDVKFMGAAADEARMEKILRGVGAQRFMAGQEIEAIVSGKLVGRNRMALMTQQIEALSAFVAENMSVRSRIGQRTFKNRLARDFLDNPMDVLKVGEWSKGSLADAEFAISRNMVSLAKRFGFTPEQMQRTFGLMDVELAERIGVELGMPTFAEQVRTSTGVIGLSKMRLGDLATGGGAGNMATLEQTGFRLLATKGVAGERLAAELATRIQGKGELVAADRLLSSVLGQQEAGDAFKRIVGQTAVDERLLGQMRAQDLIAEQGRYVKFGRTIGEFGGARGIYIPGTAEAPGLMAPLIAGGERFQPPIVRELEELRRLLARGAATEELEAAAGTIRTNILRAAEAQAEGRGRILGSKFLTGIEGAGETVRIGRGAAEEMFDDLIKRAATEEQQTFLKMQKSRLIDEEQKLIGALWRHPTTGPESVQFVQYQIDKNLSNRMMSIPFRQGQYGGRTIDISPAVGLKGDFDRDLYNIAVISDKETAARAARQVGKAGEAKYAEYLFGHYAMQDLMTQAGAAEKVAAATYEDAYIQGVRNLTAAKISTGQVNLAMQQLKIGLQYSAPDKYNSMAELFFQMEEAAISGKHGAYQGKMYQDIAHAVRQKDVATMESVLKQIMGEEARTVSNTMTIGGVTTTHQLKYDPRAWAERAIAAATTAEEDVSLSIMSARAAKNKYIPEDLETARKIFASRKGGSIDVAASLGHAKAYGMPGFTQKGTRALRGIQTRAGELGKVLRRVKGPAIVGGAIAAGIMLAAPSISGAIPTPSEGGGNVTADDLGPPEGIGMDPPRPQIMESPKVYDMSGMTTSSRAKIRMSMSDADQSGREFMRHAGALANGASVRIKTIDDRSALSPHRLANKIHERL